MSETKVADFMAITGSTSEMAESLLAVCNQNLEMAINMHMEGIDTGNGASAAAAGPSVPPIDDEEQIRAPIPQKQETLIEPGYEGYHLNSRRAQGSRNPHKARVRSVFDGFRNFGAEGQGPSSSSSSESHISKRKKRTLEELFKPPLDLIHKGSFQSARDSASAAKKWLLVNIQDAGEFQCQVLNRDVWSNEAVKTILGEHFIFWQQYKESIEAERYMTFYQVTKWPYVTILDPRTGEKLMEWNSITSSSIFIELVTEFISQKPKGFDSSPNRKKSRTHENIVDADEDDQMAAAIRASLAQSPKKSVNIGDSDDNSDSDFYLDDDDVDDSVKEKKKNEATSKISSVKTPANSESSSSSNKNKKSENWEDYLGDENDPVSSIMIRFPDGQRDIKKLPSTSKLAAVIYYVVNQGFDMESYEIVANYPRRILTETDDTKTLKESGLYPQETIFVQKR